MRSDIFTKYHESIYCDYHSFPKPPRAGGFGGTCSITACRTNRHELQSDRSNASSMNATYLCFLFQFHLSFGVCHVCVLYFFVCICQVCGPVVFLHSQPFSPCGYVSESTSGLFPASRLRGVASNHQGSIFLQNKRMIYLTFLLIFPPNTFTPDIRMYRM